MVGVGVGHLCCSMQKHGTDNEGCRSIHRILRMEVCGCGTTLRKLNKKCARCDEFIIEIKFEINICQGDHG